MMKSAEVGLHDPAHCLCTPLRRYWSNIAARAVGMSDIDDPWLLGEERTSGLRTRPSVEFGGMLVSLPHQHVPRYFAC